MKTRRNLIWLALGYICMVIFPAQSLFAQEDGNKTRLDKVRSLEIAYISRELDLSSQEAEKFWPVYNKYTREVDGLIAERRKRTKELKSNRNTLVASDAVDKEIGYERKMVDIKAKYKEEFMKVLPPEKVMKLYRVQREFRNMMIRQLKERAEGNRGQRKRP